MQKPNHKHMHEEGVQVRRGREKETQKEDEFKIKEDDSLVNQQEP